MTLALVFAEPVLLLCLLAIPLALAAHALRRRRATRYALRFTAVSSLALAAGGVRSWRRHVPLALALAALAALALALAKPQRSVAVPIERATVVLVSDHSRSMLADDVRPDRLGAAKRAANAFIDRLPAEVRVGVVTFSDGPDTVLAPTTDHDAARATIAGQQADGATATGDALQAALDALRPAGQAGDPPPAAIVLLSDGKTTVGSDPVEAARRAARLGIPIHTVALGSEDATVPAPGGLGPPLAVAPDPETLRRISSVSRGTAFTAEDGERLTEIYRALGSQIGTRSELREVTAAFAVGGLVLLLGAVASSLAWGMRLP